MVLFLANVINHFDFARDGNTCQVRQSHNIRTFLTRHLPQLLHYHLTLLLHLKHFFCRVNQQVGDAASQSVEESGGGEGLGLQEVAEVVADGEELLRIFEQSLLCLTLYHNIIEAAVQNKPFQAFSRMEQREGWSWFVLNKKIIFKWKKPLSIPSPLWKKDSPKDNPKEPIHATTISTKTAMNNKRISTGTANIIAPTTTNTEPDPKNYPELEIISQLKKKNQLVPTEERTKRAAGGAKS